MRSYLPHYIRGMLKINPITALTYAKIREQRAPSSLLQTLARCSVASKKCHVKVTGAVVRVEAYGVARAWPMITLLSGQELGAATRVRNIHSLALHAIFVNFFSKDPRPNERMAQKRHDVKDYSSEVYGRRCAHGPSE